MSAEPPPPPTASAPARAVAWIAVRLRFLMVPAFVAAAVWCSLHLHAFESGGPVVDLIPDHAPALRAGDDSLRLFGVPAGSDVIAVQHNPAGMSDDAQRRVVERARAVSQGSDDSGARAAIPLVNVPGSGASSGERDHRRHPSRIRRQLHPRRAHAGRRPLPG